MTFIFHFINGVILPIDYIIFSRWLLHHQTYLSSTRDFSSSRMTKIDPLRCAGDLNSCNLTHSLNEFFLEPGDTWDFIWQILWKWRGRPLSMCRFYWCFPILFHSWLEVGNGFRFHPPVWRILNIPFQQRWSSDHSPKNWRFPKSWWYPQTIYL